MSTTFLKDIESFFSSVEQSIAGKLSGATADTVKKVVATAAVAQHLSSVFVDAETTWASLDGQSVDAIASSVVGLVHSGDYEKAAFGLLYLVYQGAVEATNKATSVAESVLTKVETEAPKVEAAVVTTGESVIQKIEGSVETAFKDVKNVVEEVVQKAENLVGIGQTQTAAATVAPTSSATPISAPAPVVAVTNPPVQVTAAQPSPIQAPAAPAAVVQQFNPS